MPGFRGFVAVETGAPPAVVALLDELAALRADLKVVPAANLHSTVKFLGRVAPGVAGEVERALREVARAHAPMPYRLRGVGTFPPRGSPRVVWAGIEGASALAEVARELDARLEGLGFAPERRAFSAHLTLARAREGGAARLPVRAFVERHRADALGEGRFDDLVLFESVLSPRGSTYTPLARAPFGG